MTGRWWAFWRVNMIDEEGAMAHVGGSGPYRGGADVRPVPKQYGHMEDVEDQVVDPKVLEAEARGFAQERAARGGRSAVSMLWTREVGLGRVSRPHPPEPSAGQGPRQKKDDGEDMPGFADMRFQDPPPPPPMVDLATVGIPGSWPANSGEDPSAPSPYGPPSHGLPPSPYGPPSPCSPPSAYGPPAACPAPQAGRQQGGSW